MSERPFDTALPPTNEPLRVAVRRMRWFRAAFRTYVDALGDHIGCDFLIDEAKLAAIFVRWLRALEVQRPKDRKDRQAFFEFAAGLMLRELTADMPLRAETPPTRTHADSAAAFWPEGYDPRVSAGFLQMLLGHQPNWSMPDVFSGLPRAPQRGCGELATAALTALALCSITSRSAVNRSVIRMSITFWRNLSGSPSRADLPTHAPA